MGTVNVETSVTTEALLRAVSQLDSDQMADFASSVMAMRAQRLVPQVPDADLIAEVNQPISPDIEQRYLALIERRELGVLASSEYEELLTLTDQIEALDVRRAALLAELAARRGVRVTDLMRELGIDQPAHV